MSKMEKIIVLNGIPVMLQKDRDFVDNLNLSSDDMFRIFKIMADQILGMKILKWDFDCEKCSTRIWIK